MMRISTSISVFLVALSGVGSLTAQDLPGRALHLSARAVGPNQINLAWVAAGGTSRAPSRRGSVAGEMFALEQWDGYEVEVLSESDRRYQTWTLLKPFRAIPGYVCDPAVAIRGGHCGISDAQGSHVFNSTDAMVPEWVTESQFVDPLDGSPAQFIAWGLQANSAYNFRVRPVRAQQRRLYGLYSNVAAATTSFYTARYVVPTGNDSNDGSAADSGHAWRTLSYSSGRLNCGEVLIVLGGAYPNDVITLKQNCSFEAKAVIQVNPGDMAAITSVPEGLEHAIVISGSYNIVDGIEVASSSLQNSDYDVAILGHHNALLNVDVHPSIVPAWKSGITILGSDNLIYRSSVHDYGSPDPSQNPSGNGGFVLYLFGANATRNVIWSNHLSRGGHDVSLCKDGCNRNRWLDNVMDGGWGMGWEGIGASDHNLVEGNYVFDVGQLVPFYKPAIEVSSSFNTVRRNIIVNAKTVAVEVSALNGPSAGNRVYNNTIVNSATCLFVSANGGNRAYDNNIFANNICYKAGNPVTQIYPGNVSNEIAFNSFVVLDSGGKIQAGMPAFIWNHSAAGDYQYGRSITDADKVYSPPFHDNAKLEIFPEFEDEAKLNLQLRSTSGLCGAGTVVSDPEWGPIAKPVDIGAYGLRGGSDLRRRAR